MLAVMSAVISAATDIIIWCGKDQPSQKEQGQQRQAPQASAPGPVAEAAAQAARSVSRPACAADSPFRGRLEP